MHGLIPSGAQGARLAQRWLVAGTGALLAALAMTALLPGTNLSYLLVVIHAMVHVTIVARVEEPAVRIVSLSLFVWPLLLRLVATGGSHLLGRCLARPGLPDLLDHSISRIASAM